MPEDFELNNVVKPTDAPETKNVDTYDMERQTIMRFRQDTRQRGSLVDWVQGVISVWLMMVIFILIGCGHGCLVLTDTVLGFLLVTTTFNILGMAYIVLGDLFPGGRSIGEILAGNKGH